MKSEFTILTFCFWRGSKEQQCFVPEGGFKIFLRGPREMERFSLDLPRAEKREYAMDVTCGDVWNLWSEVAV